jgi:uncharacterized protein (TIGR03437 family)
MERMKSRSNLHPFLKTIPFVVALVVGVRPLAAQQVTEAQFIASVNSAIQPMLSIAPGKPIIMGGQHEFAHGFGIANVGLTYLLEYVDGLKAAGAQRIEFNPGYLSLNDTSVKAKYDALVQHIRQLGLMLAINVEYIPAQQPVTTFQQFQTAAVTGAVQIAARYQPDNFVIVHEPDTMAARMGIQTTVQDWDGFIRAVAPLVRQSSPQTRLGAGCYYAPAAPATQSYADQENAYFVDFATIPDLDFLTMDIYNVGTFNQYQQWAQLAHAAGKGVYIEETWIPHYLTNGLPPDWESVGLDNISTVGPTSADFASLFAPWIQAMALFASANGMESVTPFTTPAFFQYGTAGADTPEETAYAHAVVSAIAQGQLTPTGQAYLTYSRQLGIKVATSLSSASYATLPSVFNPNCGSATNPCNAVATVAPDELVSAFGVDLAASSASTPSASFPTTLASTTATLVDSSNTSYPVPLNFVSAGQVNYLVPSAAQPGAAALTITSADGTKTTSVILIAAADPGLYAANATGKGAPAGFAVCAGICAGWSGPPNQYGQFVQDLSTCGAGGCTPQPISLGAATDTVVLELFGTGVRHVASPSAVTATINGISLPVQFAGAQGQFTGEDQINVQLPYNLSAGGTVNLVLTTMVDQGALAPYDTAINSSSNTVTIDIE